MSSSPEQTALFACGPLRARELGTGDVPALQRFFENNPEYFLSVNGQGPDSVEAQREFDDLPPDGMPFGRIWRLGFVDEADRLVGMATVLSDFIVAGTWHIGLFVVATALHGTGLSQTIYRQLERWIADSGGRWVRLGVVQGNVKAERFWLQVGYTQVRERGPVTMGLRSNMLRVMVKPLAGGALADYLAQMVRDRPGTS
ncbi:MAG TPA: GNAT family N-acetyltransferase [Albitalea sp.]|jgi:GNAT superfamily N-acetyltransferase|nr:GNAT family N-acetyltransferase [Albitalea sp.]